MTERPIVGHRPSPKTGMPGEWDRILDTISETHDGDLQMIDASWNPDADNYANWGQTLRLRNEKSNIMSFE